MPEYSEKQVGIIGQYEPELCAVSGRPVRGKHSVTHYKGDGVHYVRVLNQFDHQWPDAAPTYGFPVPEENSAQDENVFVLKEPETETVNVTDSNGNVVTSFQAAPRMETSLRSRASKPASSPQPDIKADGMSKGDD